jgi:hypothetical protein
LASQPRGVGIAAERTWHQSRVRSYRAAGGAISARNPTDAVDSRTRHSCRSGNSGAALGPPQPLYTHRPSQTLPTHRPLAPRRPPRPCRPCGSIATIRPRCSRRPTGTKLTGCPLRTRLALDALPARRTHRPSLSSIARRARRARRLHVLGSALRHLLYPQCLAPEGTIQLAYRVVATRHVTLCVPQLLLDAVLLFERVVCLALELRQLHRNQARRPDCGRKPGWVHRGCKYAV